MLDTLQEFFAVLQGNTEIFRSAGKSKIKAGDLYCTTCGAGRQMIMSVLWANKMPDVRDLPPIPPLRNYGPPPEAPQLEDLVPSLFSLACVQCDNTFTALIYAGPEGPALAIFPNRPGGIGTPHTPEGVAHYLNQAHRAQSVGANSAAVAMFRGALEHLLFQQGFNKGMLGEKIRRLEANIQAGTAPKWAMDLDTCFLRVLKDLGDGAIHPNDGDVSKQGTLDTELLAKLTDIFQMLLYLAYEVEHEKGQRLHDLRSRILKRR